MNLLERRGGMDRWSGLLEWNTGVPRPQAYNSLADPIVIYCTTTTVPFHRSTPANSYTLQEVLETQSKS